MSFARIGPYEITARLGEGGMGEVFRALDSDLKREVAIKMLPPAFTADAERLARFEREAQLLAQLHHPNIASIFGLERSGGALALVMELVEGEDLAPRMARGPIPAAEAIAIARQVAEALEAAHEKGIVHRDLKPQNIKLRPDGAVKVLDFGLAKAMDPIAAGTGAADLARSPTMMNSPTLTAMHGTQMGVILGTAAYMAPEQARGGAVDKRADIWAFGVVLFEMLAGRSLFAGPTVSDTLAGVLKSEIDWKALPAATPPAIRRLLRRCLERNPKNRLHDIADARIVIDEVVSGTAAEPEAPGVPAPEAPWRRRLPWIGGALLLLLGLALGALVGPRAGPGAIAAEPSAPVRFTIRAPEDVKSIWNPELASDGSFVLFRGRSDEGDRFFLHRFATGATSALSGFEEASAPFLSPDGRWVAFKRGREIWKQTLDGGQPLKVCGSCEIASGAAWLEDGSILYNRAWLGGLSLVAAEGGEPRDLTTPDEAQREKGHWFPRPLPGGRHALFTIFPAGSGINDAWIAVVELASGNVRRLLPGADAQYQAPGQIVFYRAGAYHAVRFDLETLAVAGEPLKVLDDAVELEPQGTPLRSVEAGPSGALSYRPGSLAEPSVVAWVAPGSEPRRLPFEARAFADLALAPNGRDAVASALEAGAFVLYHLDLEAGSAERLLLPGSNWSPYIRLDGSAVAYISLRKGDFDVHEIDLGGGGQERSLLSGQMDEQIQGWSADGRDLVGEISQPDGSYPLFAVPLGGGERRQLVGAPFDLDETNVSPDGRWLLFSTTHTGRPELYMQPYAGSGGAVRVTRRGGSQPRWSPDGRTIFFRNEDAILAVPFRVVAGRPEFGAESKLLEAPLAAGAEPLATIDGRRFLVLLREKPLAGPELRIVLGWDREVAARLEAKR